MTCKIFKSAADYSLMSWYFKAKFAIPNNVKACNYVQVLHISLGLLIGAKHKTQLMVAER